LPANETAHVNIQRMYDSLAAVYPASSNLLHSLAHQNALAAASICNGMSVLEVATGSGEMFRRIASVNPNGMTVGLDLAPKMAARTQADIQEAFPNGNNICHAADARYLPFKDASFDAIVCCYLLELIPAKDLEATLAGFHRVLRPGGRLAITLIGENLGFFNFGYKICAGLVPAFWGDQMEDRATSTIARVGFEVTHDQRVRQLFYPSRVLVATRR